MKSFSNKTKGDNSKSKKARVVNLVCNTLSSYIGDKKFYADADTNANRIRPKNNTRRQCSSHWGITVYLS